MLPGFFDCLREIGILFENPFYIIEHVKKVFDDVSAYRLFQMRLGKPERITPTILR